MTKIHKGDEETASLSPTVVVEKDSSETSALAVEAERLIGDLEYGCAADFTEYRPAALAIARAYLRTFRQSQDSTCASPSTPTVSAIVNDFAHHFHDEVEACIRERDFTALVSRLSLSITQDGASASAQTQDVTDKGSVQYDPESVSLSQAVADMKAELIKRVREKAEAYWNGVGGELSDECKRELRWQAIALKSLATELEAIDLGSERLSGYET